MPIPFLNSIKLNKNQVEDFCVFNYSGDPTLSSGADFGYLWLNTSATPKVLKFWDGTNYRTLIDSTTISTSTAGLATDLAGGGAGQVVYQDGANDTKFLAAGTAGQVLSSNGSSAPSWLDQSSLSVGSATNATTSTNIAGGAAGNVLYQSGAGATAKLTTGTQGQILAVNTGATAPEWINQSAITAGSAALATDVAGGAAGKILYQSAVNDTDFLAVGTNGQVLTSSGTGPQWSNQSSLAAGTAANISGGLAGQLLYQSALATTAKLTIGTAGQALVVNSGATAPEWVDQSSLSVGSAANKTGGAAGDILVQSASGSTGFLSAGTNGQVITSNGTSPQYVNQSSLSVGSATTAGAATNIAGGAANRIPYQTAAGTTAFISDNANSILTTNASSVPALTSATSVTVGKAIDIALGAAGDLLYQSASNDTSFLNIGANGSILTSTGAAPQWSASIPAGSVSGLAASATTDTTSASNISSGTLGLARLSLANGRFYVGDGSNNPAATLKSSIPLSGFGAAGDNVAMGNFKITGLADPESGTDAANKNYVDSVAQGLDVKASCKVGTIANITLSGPGASIDGISLSVDDRVLVKDQTDKKENGIYLWKGAASAMVRSADADTVAKLTSAFTFVEQGTNADSGWVCTVDSGTIGSVNIEWLKFSQAGSYTQGRGMVLDGTAFNFAQSTNYTANTIPYASGASTIGFIGAGNADQVLRVPGAGGTPAFGAIDLTKSAAVTGALAVGNGGTGLTSYAIGDILYANTTTSLAKLADVATGSALISGGVDTAPSWGKIGLTTHVSGTLPVGNGGTGATTFTAGRVLFGNGTSALNTSANLFWDNSNNRLGIGTAPSYALHSVVTSGASAAFKASTAALTYALVGNTAGDLVIQTDASGNGQIYADTGKTLGLRANGSGTSHLSIASDGVCTWSNVGGVAGTAMTLNGTGLGVGITPAAILHVEGSAAQARFSVASATDARHEYFRNSVRQAYIGWDANDFAIFATQAGGVLRFGSGNTERLRIKSTGQVNFVGLASDPAGAAGDVVYNSTSNRLKYHNGTAWVNTGTNKYSGALTGTGTSFTVTHNLGTRDVTVSVRKSGSTYDQVFTDVQMTDTNTVTIVFASSVTGSDYTVTVIG